MAFGMIQNAISQPRAISFARKWHNGARKGEAPQNTGNIDETQPETKRYVSGNNVLSAINRR